jgi:putative tryptophan/tyrosine transport system substrate-binding protein
MRRREFIAGVGSAVACPMAARSQQVKRVRRIALLMGGAEGDPIWQSYLATVREVLASRGWTEGRDLQIDVRFGESDINRIRALAAELVGLGPEAILAGSGAATGAMRQETQTLPIVGVGPSPIANLVQNIARPEGNVTLFPVVYETIGGKWVELLKDAVPRLKRIGVIFNTDTAAEKNRTVTSYQPSIDTAAEILGLKRTMVLFRSDNELQQAVKEFAAESDGGLIITPGAGTATRDNRRLVRELAARYEQPVIHWDKAYPAEGGLMSYGSDFADLYRRAAAYVDRILRGAKVSELPVDFPTKFDLVINLKAAKAVGLTISEAFLLGAEKVME